MPLVSAVDRVAWMLRVQGRTPAEALAVLRRAFPELPPHELRAIVAFGQAAEAAGREMERLPPEQPLPAERVPGAPAGERGAGRGVFTYTASVLIKALIESPPGSRRVREETSWSTVTVSSESPLATNDIISRAREVIAGRVVELQNIVDVQINAVRRGE